MSRRARTRAAAVAAKHVALVPLAGHDDDHDDWDEADDECPHCHGDGRDPDCDYLLPCPLCMGDA